jgi:hypothetical protein
MAGLFLRLSKDFDGSFWILVTIRDCGGSIKGL